MIYDEVFPTWTLLRMDIEKLWTNIFGVYDTKIFFLRKKFIIFLRKIIDIGIEIII